MNIKTSNPLIRYYQFIYGDLAIDFCSLFWGLMYAIPFFIIEIPALFTARKLGWIPDKPVVRTVMFWYVVIVAIGLTNLLLNINWHWMILVWFLAAVVCSVILLAIIATPIYFISEYVKKRKEANPEPEEEKESEPPKFFIWWGALRRKHCIKINYIAA